MTRKRHRTGTQVAPRAAAAARFCALAAALALCLAAPVPAALADEVDGEGSFELNLSMSVDPADDPEAAVHPVSVHVGDGSGGHVGGARVTYELLSDYAPAASAPAAAGASAAEPRAASGMVRAGEAVTAADGTADLEGVVLGCDYRVAVEADGHVRHESVRTCAGADGERWEVVLEKAAGAGDGTSNGTGGSTGGAGGTGAAGGKVAGLPPLLSSLTRTGDALAPLVLAVAGALAAAAALVLLARRRKDARDGR